MITALDSNIVSALWKPESNAKAITRVLSEAADQGELINCGAVHSELLAYPRSTQAVLEGFFESSDITVDFGIGEEIWREAGRAFGEYAERRRHCGGGLPKQFLMDFVIGAHALLRADRLLTLDRARYVRAYPKLRIMPVPTPAIP